MKYLRILPLFLITTLLFVGSSCDTIKPPFEDNPTNTNPDTQAVQRVVLVEDFTGIKCPNCPEASHYAHSLLEGTYKDKMILVGVHAGNLAKPNTSGDFIADYRTDVGTDLYNTFLLDHVPVASINRIVDGGVHWLEKGLWEAKIAEEVAKDAEIKMDITTTYNDATRSLSISVANEFLTDATATENLVVYLIEDGIISPQDSMGVHVHDYEHRNMLRGSLNTSWGENLSTTAITTGTKITKDYTYTIDPNFNVDNCSVVAFVHNNDTKIVRQAAIKKIK